jgi:molybdopterin converting factor small subunit
MVIEVKMGDPLWRIVGQQRIKLELADGSTVSDALTSLRATYPEFGSALKAGGTHQGIPFNFFVNRKLVKDRDVARHNLKTGDTLYILAPIVGGEAVEA